MTINDIKIELVINASTTIEWGAVLSQYQEDGKAHPARFEIGIWSDQERKYNILKLECHESIKELKKLRFCLFGCYFTIVTDSETLM